MTIVQEAPEARLELRLSREEQQRLEQAATAAGLSLSDFAALTLLQQADEVLQRGNVTILSDRDFERFVEIVESDSEPTEAARNAAAAYRQGRVEGERYFC